MTAADVWAAVGQIGAFVVAAAALIYSFVVGRSNRATAEEAKRLAERSTGAAERSADAAESSADAARATALEARRANEAASEARRAQEREAEDGLWYEVGLVRPKIYYASGQQLPGDRVSVDAVWISVDNNGSVYPAIDVEWRHRELFPTFKLLAEAVMPGECRPPHRAVPAIPFETAADNSEMQDGFEVRYRMAGRTYLRGSRSEPQLIPSDAKPD